MSTVTVTGHGTSADVPDIAVVRFSVSAREATLAAAYGRTSELAEQARRVCLEHTDERRVATSGVQLWQAHDNQGVRVGFEARHGFTVGCADLASGGSLLEALVDRISDALQVDDVSLQLSDPAAALGRARESAFADARARAEHLAALAGRTLGEVLDVVEGEGFGGGGGPQPRFALAAEAFSPGEQKVEGQVRVTFRLG